MVATTILSSRRAISSADRLFTAFALQIYEDEILDRCTYFATWEKGHIVAQDVAEKLLPRSAFATALATDCYCYSILICCVPRSTPKSCLQIDVSYG